MQKPTPDHFPCGALVTNSSRVITYVNSYFTTELLWIPGELIGKSTDVIFTQSSKIFFQTYLIPTLLHEKTCEEMQLIIFNAKGVRIPVTVNAHYSSDGCIYWSFFNASKRDQLYDELIKTRETLEEQAEALKLLASTDELTELLNRREMSYRGSLVLEQAARSQQSVSLLMFDIDYFKKINDAFGHVEGDRVLQELGQKLKAFCRQTDLVARVGGEEFLILLPDTDKTDTLLFCQRLHQLIATVMVDNKPLTVSIGVSIYENKISFTDFYAQADKAVYQAKNLGRNRTELYQTQ
ncbi:diguanylate cyclase [Colwellia hornerae]|uniref:diguanylate cyclase n=1 Tax=Colwellia hornerae TaxID=89402 RepID=A0A5C6Q2W6_9GAMM|nr:diguanylate cyclase [Colwellia hornerae]TWX53908.1 diguanylate cyclase [Colwellia hornerae]TWX63027.1 diguanylate cyclase [Colwellia hornerae]